MERTLLIVDDDELIRKTFKEIMTHEGYRVIDTDDGLEAIDIIKNQSCPIIFLDIIMPKLDGISLCKKIREINQIAWISAITGKRALFEIADCREAGFDDYFTKPLDMILILNEVKVALTRLIRWEGKLTANS